MNEERWQMHAGRPAPRRKRRAPLTIQRGQSILMGAGQKEPLGECMWTLLHDNAWPPIRWGVTNLVRLP